MAKAKKKKTNPNPHAKRRRKLGKNNQYSVMSREDRLLSKAIFRSSKPTKKVTQHMIAQGFKYDPIDQRLIPELPREWR